jgi:hypothetical protein
MAAHDSTFCSLSHLHATGSARSNRCGPSGSHTIKKSLTERLRRDRARKEPHRQQDLNRGHDHAIPRRREDPSPGPWPGRRRGFLGVRRDPGHRHASRAADHRAHRHRQRPVLVQCAPCNSTECYPWQHLLFDPTSSLPPTPPPRRTATRAKHSSKTSTASAAQTPPPVPPCASTYDIAYGGGETTVGLFSTETLTLKPGVTINNFRFGCGSHQRGKYDKFDGLHSCRRRRSSTAAPSRTACRRENIRPGSSLSARRAITRLASCSLRCASSRTFPRSTL